MRSCDRYQSETRGPYEGDKRAMPHGEESSGINACHALRFSLISGDELSADTMHAIREELRLGASSVRATLEEELENADGRVFDLVASALLTIDPEGFAPLVVRALVNKRTRVAHEKTEVELRKHIQNDFVCQAVLDTLLNCGSVGQECGTSGRSQHEMLIRILVGCVDKQKVRTALLEMLTLVSERSLVEWVLSHATEYPDVVSHFVRRLKRDQFHHSELDLVEVLLKAPASSDVIEGLATRFGDRKHGDAILERIAGYLDLPHVRNAIITTLVSAQWSDATYPCYEYTYSETRRRRAAEILDAALDGEVGDLVADCLVLRLKTQPGQDQFVESGLIKLLTERLKVPAIQRALVRGLADEAQSIAHRCAELLTHVCEQPAVRGLLRDAALLDSGKAAHLAIVLLRREFCSTLRGPAQKIGERSLYRRQSVEQRGTPWE